MLGTGFGGSPGRRLRSRCAAPRLLQAICTPLQGCRGPSPLGGPGCPVGRGMPRRKLRWSNYKSPFSWMGGKEFQPLPTTSGPPQPTFPRGLAAPAPNPTPATRLPRSPHKAHGSPAEESHRYLAPGPCAQPGSPSRSRWPPAPQQRWQLQFKCLIKASRGGGEGRAGPTPRPRPGARGATGGAGQLAGGRAGARRRRGPGAPACASSSGQTLFSSSVELRLVKRRRPPPPSPGSPAPPIPVRGGRLKGTPRLFLAPAQPLGLPGLPGSPHPAPPVPGAPRRGPASPAPARAGRTRRARRFEGLPTPTRGNPAPAPFAETPAVRAGAGRSWCESGVPRGLAPLHCNSLRPIPAPKFAGEGVRFPGHETHLPAPSRTTELQTRAHNEIARSMGAIGLLRCLKHAGLNRVRALTSPEFA